MSLIGIKFNLKFNRIVVVLIYTTMVSVLLSCQKKDDDFILTEIEPSSFGWTPDFENYDYTYNISNGIFGAGNLPLKVDLSDKLPPAGDQGNYGTCVTWSMAYGMRTYMNAVSKNLISLQLLDPENQFSPADLWMSLPEKDRIGYCGGTSFQPAFNVLVTRGVTNMRNVPYSKIKCTDKSTAWSDDAANHKIANYFMINKSDWSASTFKTYLAQHQAVCIGTRLGDKFKTWKSGVLSDDTYQNPMYHAMLLIGYDDNKGSRGAFKVFNSWGSKWGENGHIWIDYDFFLSDRFLNCAFTAVPLIEMNPNSEYELDDSLLSEGSDLVITDVSTPELHEGTSSNRIIRFNVYNAGTKTINASDKWSIVLMYYNAHNAKDNGVLAHLYYTDQVNENSIVHFNNASASVLAGLQIPITDPNGYHAGRCINRDIPSGKNIASVYYDNKRQYIDVQYYMPPVNGEYYIAVLVDPYNRIEETNEQNNTFIVSRPDGSPYYFFNGRILK